MRARPCTTTLALTILVLLATGCRHPVRPAYDDILRARFPDAALDDRTLCSKLAFQPASAAFDDPEPALRRKAIVSDLHLGPGDGDQRFRGLEDFHYADTLVGFLDRQHAAGPTDLIVNGDALELWQVLGALDRLPSRDDPLQRAGAPMLAADQEGALAALAVITAAHRRELEALGRFVGRGDHRLIFVPGNHDADILWPKVQLELARVIHPPEPARILFVQGAVYRHGGVHIEHGHRFDGANRTMSAHAPFAFDTAGQCRTLASWGEVFVARFFNRTEQRFPFLDNLYPESASLLWALEEEPEKLAVAETAARFIELLVSEQSHSLNLTFLKSELRKLLGLPTGRDESIRAVPGEIALHLLDRFATRERLLDGIWLIVSDPGLAHVAESFVNAARALPDLRAAGAALHQITDADLDALRAFVFGDLQETAAARILDEEPMTSIVVFGHTHVPGGKIKEIHSRGRAGHYANSGTWIPVARVGDLKRSGVKWTSLDPRDRRMFPASFPAVVIEYAGGRPLTPRMVVSDWLDD